MNKNIKKGKKILLEIFGNNPYSQLSLIRQELWANDVIIDDLYKEIEKLKKNLDETYKSNYKKVYTKEYLTSAKEIKEKSRKTNTEIEQLLDYFK